MTAGIESQESILESEMASQDPVNKSMESQDSVQSEMETKDPVASGTELDDASQKSVMESEDLESRVKFLESSDIETQTPGTSLQYKISEDSALRWKVVEKAHQLPMVKDASSMVSTVYQKAKVKPIAYLKIHKTFPTAKL